ncbi:hypothetical protein Emag_002492 [Eimeria magna]
MPSGWRGDTQGNPSGGLQQPVLEGLVCFYFLAAAAAAAAAARWPTFAALAAHGKVRWHATNTDGGSDSSSSRNSSNSSNTSNTPLRLLRRLRTQTCIVDFRVSLQFASHVVLANLRRQCPGPEWGPSKPHFVSGGVKGSDGCMIKEYTQRRRSSSSSNNSSRSSNGSSRRGSSSGSSSVGAPKYGIPRGPLFAYTSCPHYLAEVFLYLSLFLSAPSVPL